MTDNDKALATELRGIAAELSCNQYAAQVWVIGQAADRIETQAAEIERLREWSLKAFTIVEWVVGEGKLLEYPCYDADDTLCDGVDLLGAYSAAHARATLEDAK